MFVRACSSSDQRKPSLEAKFLVLLGKLGGVAGREESIHRIRILRDLRKVGAEVGDRLKDTRFSE